MKRTLITFGILAAATFSSQAALVAHWDLNSLNESASSTAGTLSGDAAVGGTAIAPGSAGALTTTTGGFETNMTADAITGFGGTGSFTILSWVQTSSATNQTVFSYSPSVGATGGADLRYFVQANGNMRVEMSAGAGFELDLGAVNLNDGATHMIGVLFNSATGNSFRDLQLYVDGTLHNVTGGTDHEINLIGTGTINDGNQYIRIGRDQTTKHFVGTIDDVAIFDEALSSTQLSDIALNGIPEPSAAILSAIGALALLRRRRG